MKQEKAWATDSGGWPEDWVYDWGELLDRLMAEKRNKKNCLTLKSEKDIFVAGIVTQDTEKNICPKKNNHPMVQDTLLTKD